MKTTKKKSAKKTVASKRNQPFNPRKILVPLDFSEESYKALEHAAGLSLQFKASLRLVHVVEPAPYPEFGYAHMAIKEKQHMAAARKRLREALEDPILESFTSKSGQVRHGNASMEIVEEARTRGIELIVLTSHGQSALLKWLMGSTAERVVQHAHCPVLVIPLGKA